MRYKPRTLRQPLAEKLCKRCKESFSPYRENQVYCSPTCRVRHYWETHEVVKTDAGDQAIPVDGN